MSDRTLQPTAKRRKQAREEGRVVASGQVVSAVVWLAFAALAFSFSGRFLSSATSQMQQVWSEPQSAGQLGSWVQGCLAVAGAWVLPVVGIIFVLSILTRLAQTGFIWAPNRIIPDTTRMNPASRLQSMFSPHKAFELLRGAGVVVCALLLVGGGIWFQREELLQLPVSADFESSGIRLLASWGLKLGLCLVVFAVIDYAVQRYRFEQSLMMTPEELRSEVKAISGNPAVATGRKRMRHEFESPAEQNDSQ